jgi:hypothetical protein
MGGHCVIALAICVQLGCASDMQSKNVDAAPGDDGCATVWYADADKDGYGDPEVVMTACAQPPDTVASKDDCDDRAAHVHPGASELCDGVDNDCDSFTLEMCPMSCQPSKRPQPDAAHTYLFCNRAVSYPMAQSICAGEGYALVRIDDAAENAWLRMTGTTMFGGVTFHFGANDLATEGAWFWDGTTVQFWQGGTGGTIVGGHYNNWNGGEPNNSNNEDCGKMLLDGSWTDSDCPDGQRFVCER